MQTMEGTLERKQKLQLGGKKVRRLPHGVGKASTVSKCKALQSAAHADYTLLSYFHRQPPEAGTPTTPSYTGTPCASTRTERIH